jgi:hypothetical protein
MIISRSSQVMCEMGIIECEMRNEARMEEMLMASSRLAGIQKPTLSAGFDE